MLLNKASSQLPNPLFRSCSAMGKKKKRKKRIKQEPEKPTSEGNKSNLIDRYLYLLLCLILIIALVVRVIALAQIEDSIYGNEFLLDENVYHNLAQKIASGTYDSKSVYEFAPLPAYVNAAVYKLFSPDISNIRILNLILGLLTCFLVFLIGRELAGPKAGLLACLIAALYKPFIFYSIVPMKTGLSVSILALTVYIFLSSMNKISLVKILLLGIVAGLIINVRPNYAIFLPVLPIFILWNGYEASVPLKKLLLSLLLFFLGITLSISPFLIRNYRVTGQAALTTTQAGFNLYFGNNLDQKDPYYRPLPFASSSAFDQGIQFTIEASRRLGKKITHKEASPYWTKQVIKMALERPLDFTRKLFLKTLVFFNRFEAGDHYHIGFMSDFVKVLKFPFFSLWLILPLGMAGMIVNIFREKNFTALGVMFFMYAFTLVVFFTNTRFRLPMMKILIPFTAVGIIQLHQYFINKQNRKIITYSASFIAFLIVAFLPVRATGDLTAYYNTHAIVLIENGFSEEAEKYWEASSNMKGSFSVFADLALAERYYRKYGEEKALKCLYKIPDDSFGAAFKYELIGDVMKVRRDYDQAILFYIKSLEINSGLQRVRKKLIDSYKETDRKKAEQETETYKYISSFYNVN